MCRPTASLSPTENCYPAVIDGETDIYPSRYWGNVKRIQERQGLFPLAPIWQISSPRPKEDYIHFYCGLSTHLSKRNTHLITQHSPKIFSVLAYMRCSINTHALRSWRSEKKHFVLRIKMCMASLGGNQDEFVGGSLKEEQKTQSRDPFSFRRGGYKPGCLQAPCSLLLNLCTAQTDWPSMSEYRSWARSACQTESQWATSAGCEAFDEFTQRQCVLVWPWFPSSKKKKKSLF